MNEEQNKGHFITFTIIYVVIFVISIKHLIWALMPFFYTNKNIFQKRNCFFIILDLQQNHNKYIYIF